MSRRAPQPPLPTTVLRGHSSGVQAVCFLNEDVLLSGSQDGVVKVWNLERRRVCAEFEATSHGMGVQRLDRLGQNRVVSQGRDGLIKVWDAERFAGGGGHGGDGNGDRTKKQRHVSSDDSSRRIAPEPLQELATGAFHFCQFALTRWREETMTAGGQGTSGGCDDNRGVQGGPEAGLGERGASSGEGKYRACFNGKGAGGREEKEVAVAAPAPAEDNISGGSFAENALLAPSNEQHSVCMWDLRHRAPAYTIAPADAERKGMVMCVRLLGESASCASPFAVCGHDSGYLCVYDLRATSAEPLMESRLHKEPLLCVDVGSSCTQGVSGSADDSINVFKISNKKGSCEVVKTFRSEHPGTSCVEIRRDQKLFMTGGWDHRVRAFSWKTPRRLAVLRSHEGSVYSLAYSPRIGGLVSGSADSRVAVWDVFGERGDAISSSS